MLKSTSLFYISLVFILSWGPMFKTSTDKSVSERVAIEPAYEISLAQWSLHRAFFGPQKEGSIPTGATIGAIPDDARFVISTVVCF